MNYQNLILFASSNSVMSVIPPETMPIIIVLVSIVLFTLVVERLLFYSKWKPFHSEEIRSLRKAFQSKNWEESQRILLSNKDNPSSIILNYTIEKFKSSSEVFPEDLESDAFISISKLERFLTGIGTIATVGPLLGVLGTVTGIIRSFAEGSGTKGAEVGISEALITTAMGLFIAIPAYVFFNLFTRKKEIAINEMENLCNLLIENIDKNENKKNSIK